MKIPEFKLVPQPVDDDAAALPPFKWAGPEVGKRHKLGGDPQFLRQEEWPCCPSCKEAMSFYGQLDSISDDICIADCGVIHVFLCFDCCESKSIVQSA